MFTRDVTETAIRFDMSAEFGHVDLACREAEAFIDGTDASECRFAVLLGLREALTNAVLHGCGGDGSKTVRARVERMNGAVTISVEDEGPGFDWAKAGTSVPDPWSMGGRGLPIIHEYFDTVAFNETGNVITFSLECRRANAMGIVTRDGNSALVEPGTDIVASTADTMKHDLKALLEDGVTTITIDMKGVDVVDSIGIGLLIATHNSLSAFYGGLRLTNVNDDIADLLGKMRLDKHFHVETA